MTTSATPRTYVCPRCREPSRGLCDFCAADQDLERPPRSEHPDAAARAALVLAAMEVKR